MGVGKVPQGDAESDTSRPDPELNGLDAGGGDGGDGGAGRGGICGAADPLLRGHSNRLSDPVTASTNVTCPQARHVVEVAFAVNGHRNQCYAGHGNEHACTVQGFRCTFHGHGQEFGYVRCTKARRKLIFGGNG
ncbi:MAG: hypothetical protein ACR2QA_02800 [Solirubrobacteraceae bacterium]